MHSSGDEGSDGEDDWEYDKEDEARAPASVRHLRLVPSLCSLVLAGAIVVLVLISSSASAAEPTPPDQTGSSRLQEVS